MEIKREYYDLIRSGSKTVEGRKASPTWIKLKENTLIDIKCSETGRILTCFITKIDRCKDIHEYLKKYLSKALPNKTYQEGYEIYRELWKDELFKYEILAIHINVLNS